MRTKHKTAPRCFRISVIDLASRTWSEIEEDDVFGRAAQLAYYFFLALLPFIICVVSSLSTFGYADRGRAILFDVFQRFLPPTAFQLIVQSFNEIVRSGGPLKMSVGVVVSLWTASLGMGAVMDALNAANKLKETRSPVRQYIVAIGLTLGIIVLIVICLLVAVSGSAIVSTFYSGSVIALVWRLLQWLSGLALLLLAFELTYYFAPDIAHRRWHWVTPGAIVGLFLLLVVSVGLRVYVHHFGPSSTTYGSLGAVIVLLLTLYFGGIALLTGGALNAVVDAATECEGTFTRCQCQDVE